MTVLDPIKKSESLTNIPNFSGPKIWKMDDHIEFAARPYPNFGEFGKLESLENMRALCNPSGVHRWSPRKKRIWSAQVSSRGADIFVP